MKFPILNERESHPPSLNMNDYIAFVDDLNAFRAPEHVRRQKEMEERIEVRFRFPEEGVEA